MRPTSSIAFSKEWLLSILFSASVAVFLALTGGGFFWSIVSHHRLPSLFVSYAPSPNARNEATPISALQVAASIDFDNPQPQLRLLAAAQKAGDPAAILAARHGLLRLSPYDPLSHGELASALLQNNDLKEALLHSSIAIQLAPNNAKVLCTHGTTLLASGDKVESARAFRRALQLDPDLEAARLALEYPLKGF